MIPLAQNLPCKLKIFFLILTTRCHESLQGLNSSLAQSAAELWPAKVCPKRANYAFLKNLELGQKLGFWPIILAKDMLASQSTAL